MPVHLVYSGNPMPDLSWVFFRFAPFLINHRSTLAIITADTIILNLKGRTKEAVINELLNLLQANGKLLDQTTVLNDILDREQAIKLKILSILNEGLKAGNSMMPVPNSITEELRAKDIFGLEALTKLRREKE
jgi:hypothetical protein